MNNSGVSFVDRLFGTSSTNPSFNAYSGKPFKAPAVYSYGQESSGQQACHINNNWPYQDTGSYRQPHHQHSNKHVRKSKITAPGRPPPHKKHRRRQSPAQETTGDDDTSWILRLQTFSVRSKSVSSLSSTSSRDETSPIKVEKSFTSFGMDALTDGSSRFRFRRAPPIRKPVASAEYARPPWDVNRVKPRHTVYREDPVFNTQPPSCRRLDYNVPQSQLLNNVVKPIMCQTSRPVLMEPMWVRLPVQSSNQGRMNQIITSPYSQCRMLIPNYVQNAVNRDGQIYAKDNTAAEKQERINHEMIPMVKSARPRYPDSQHRLINSLPGQNVRHNTSHQSNLSTDQQIRLNQTTSIVSPHSTGNGMFLFKPSWTHTIDSGHHRVTTLSSPTETSPDYSRGVVSANDLPCERSRIATYHHRVVSPNLFDYTTANIDRNSIAQSVDSDSTPYKYGRQSRSVPPTRSNNDMIEWQEQSRIQQASDFEKITFREIGSQNGSLTINPVTSTEKKVSLSSRGNFSNTSVDVSKEGKKSEMRGEHILQETRPTASQPIANEEGHRTEDKAKSKKQDNKKKSQSKSSTEKKMGKRKTEKEKTEKEETGLKQKASNVEQQISGSSKKKKVKSSSGKQKTKEGEKSAKSRIHCQGKISRDTEVTIRITTPFDTSGFQVPDAAPSNQEQSSPFRHHIPPLQNIEYSRQDDVSNKIKDRTSTDINNSGNQKENLYKSNSPSSSVCPVTTEQDVQGSCNLFFPGYSLGFDQHFTTNISEPRISIDRPPTADIRADELRTDSNNILSSIGFNRYSRTTEKSNQEFQTDENSTERRKSFRFQSMGFSAVDSFLDSSPALSLRSEALDFRVVPYGSSPVSNSIGTTDKGCTSQADGATNGVVRLDSSMHSSSTISLDTIRAPSFSRDAESNHGYSRTQTRNCENEKSTDGCNKNQVNCVSIEQSSNKNDGIATYSNVIECKTFMNTMATDVSCYPIQESIIPDTVPSTNVMSLLTNRSCTKTRESTDSTPSCSTLEEDPVLPENIPESRSSLWSCSTPVAYAHVIQLDVDDTLIPTSQFCEYDWLDRQLDELPVSYRNKLNMLDQQLTRLFHLLHYMVVHEDVLIPTIAETQLPENPSDTVDYGRAQLINDQCVGGGYDSLSGGLQENTPVSLGSIDTDVGTPMKLEEFPIHATLDIDLQKKRKRNSAANKRVDDFNDTDGGRGEELKPPLYGSTRTSVRESNATQSSLFPNGSLLTPRGKTQTPRGVMKHNLSNSLSLMALNESESCDKSVKHLDVNDQWNDGESNLETAVRSVIADAEIRCRISTVPVSDPSREGYRSSHPELAEPKGTPPGFQIKTPRNYLLSVVIVTNATMCHIRSIFPKFFPILTAFFQEKQISLDDLVCSARDLWGDEFPFEHFYDFWKCWTLEDVLSQLRNDGVKTLTVLSIGDDEPERKAAAYVQQEMPDLVKGLKIVKMASHPDIDEISIQLEYLIYNLREYIHRTSPFDVVYVLEEPGDLDLQPRLLGVIDAKNEQSAVVRNLKGKIMRQEGITEEDALKEKGRTKRRRSTFSEDIAVPSSKALDMECLRSSITEVAQTSSPKAPNPFESALIQFELKFEEFYKLFSRIKNRPSPSWKHQSTIDESFYTNMDSAGGETFDLSDSSNLSTAAPLPDSSSFSPSLDSKLNEALKNRCGLRECIAEHVLNLIGTHYDELLVLGRDCVGFMQQIQRELPTILESKNQQEEKVYDDDDDEEQSVGGVSLDFEDSDRLSFLSKSSDVLLGLVHNVIRFLIVYPTMFLEFTQRDHQVLTACVVHLLVDVLTRQHNLLLLPGFLDSPIPVFQTNSQLPEDKLTLPQTYATRIQQDGIIAPLLSQSPEFSS